MKKILRENIEHIFESGSVDSETIAMLFGAKDNKYEIEFLTSSFIENKKSNINLETYSKILSFFDIEDFSCAITCLYEMHKSMNIPFTREDKKEMTISILKCLSKTEIKNYEEYRARLIHAISGLYRFDDYLVQSKSEMTPLND